MIALTRNRTAAAVHNNFKGAARIANNLALLILKRDGQLDSNVNKVLKSSVWGEAKKQLLIETKDKCAYCETPTAVVAYGDVEHFRPKSTYWWLAYCYENYLASCTICNQRYKRDHFQIRNAAIAGPVVDATFTDAQLQQMAPLLTPDPVDNTTGMPLADLQDAMNNEYALLIDPYFEDPADFLAYKPILATREVMVIPAKKQFEDIVKACDDFFGINRKELLDLRFQHYCTYMTYKHTLAAGELPAQITKMLNTRLKEMAMDGSRYAGMIRFLNTKPLKSLPWDFDLVIDL